MGTRERHNNICQSTRQTKTDIHNNNIQGYIYYLYYYMFYVTVTLELRQ